MASIRLQLILETTPGVIPEHLQIDPSRHGHDTCPIDPGIGPGTRVLAVDAVAVDPGFGPVCNVSLVCEPTDPEVVFDLLVCELVDPEMVCGPVDHEITLTLYWRTGPGRKYPA